jgi:dsRNA-specific ribonuclease
LNIDGEEEMLFKKSFQKLLMSVLGDENLGKEYLFELYHNLGEKVLSKLVNPLILSNHCISRFALDPEIQI